MSIDSTDNTAGAPPAGVPGEQLKAAREAMGLSVEQIADQLKMHPRQVVAIEAGDYAALPPSAVVRGFVRAYAKVVRLDATPLVAQIPVDAAAAAADASAGMRRATPASFSESRFPLGHKRSRFPLLPVAAGVVIVGALAAAWALGLLPVRPHTEKTEAVAPAATPVTPPAVQNPAATTPGTVTAAAPTAAGTEGVVVPSATTPLVSVPPAGAEPQAAAPSAGAAVAPVSAAPVPSTQPPAAPGSTNTLVLNVKEDSWIQVKPENGKSLFSGLVKAGSTETVEISGPVVLVVGNPAGVSATLRNVPVELPPTKGVVARVNLK
ncbi:MAG: helix-turn-helix domain-containing protein [Telluria sp.]